MAPRPSGRLGTRIEVCVGPLLARRMHRSVIFSTVQRKWASPREVMSKSGAEFMKSIA